MMMIIIIITIIIIHFNICKEIGVQLDKKTLVRTCIKLSSNESRRQGDSTVEPASANGQNYPQ